VNAERHAARWPVLVALALLILITVIFIVEFVVSTQSEMVAKQTAPATLTANTYMDKVALLLSNANPENGAKLVEQYNCVACHREGAENHIAPAFKGMAERAATRRPPLSAPAYIYEAITHPMAYLVQDFSPVMPQNFSELLPDQDLGDIIAYLLTPNAH